MATDFEGTKVRQGCAWNRGGLTFWCVCVCVCSAGNTTTFKQFDWVGACKNPHGTSVMFRISVGFQDAERQFKKKQAVGCCNRPLKYQRLKMLGISWRQLLNCNDFLKLLKAVLPSPTTLIGPLCPIHWSWKAQHVCYNLLFSFREIWQKHCVSEIRPHLPKPWGRCFGFRWWNSSWRGHSAKVWVVPRW